MEWKTIDSAPKYKDVLVYDGLNYWVAYSYPHHRGSTQWKVLDGGGGGEDILSAELTHWMPLPDVPPLDIEK